MSCVPSGRRKKVAGKKRAQTKSSVGKKTSGTQLKRRKRLMKKRRGKKTRVRSHVSLCQYQNLPVFCYFIYQMIISWYSVEKYCFVMIAGRFFLLVEACTGCYAQCTAEKCMYLEMNCKFQAGLLDLLTNPITCAAGITLKRVLQALCYALTIKLLCLLSTGVSSAEIVTTHFF